MYNGAFGNGRRRGPGLLVCQPPCRAPPVGVDQATGDVVTTSPTALAFVRHLRLRRRILLHPPLPAMTHRKFSPRRLSALVLSLGILVGFGETGPSEQLPPAAITDVTGIPLVGPAGEALAERVVVRVVDAAGNPLPGVSVTFSTSGNGASVDPATTVTDDRGEARTRWTLGRTPGQQTLSVDAGGTTAQITATAGPPRIASLAVSAGNNQNGT